MEEKIKVSIWITLMMVPGFIFKDHVIPLIIGYLLMGAGYFIATRQQRKDLTYYFKRLKRLENWKRNTENSYETIVDGKTVQVERRDRKITVSLYPGKDLPGKIRFSKAELSAASIKSKIGTSGEPFFDSRVAINSADPCLATFLCSKSFNERILFLVTSKYIDSVSILSSKRTMVFELLLDNEYFSSEFDITDLVYQGAKAGMELTGTSRDFFDTVFILEKIISGEESVSRVNLLALFASNPVMKDILPYMSHLIDHQDYYIRSVSEFMLNTAVSLANKIKTFSLDIIEDIIEVVKTSPSTVETEKIILLYYHINNRAIKKDIVTYLSRHTPTKMLDFLMEELEKVDDHLLECFFIGLLGDFGDVTTIEFIQSRKPLKKTIDYQNSCSKSISKLRNRNQHVDISGRLSMTSPMEDQGMLSLD